MSWISFLVVHFHGCLYLWGVFPEWSIQFLVKNSISFINISHLFVFIVHSPSTELLPFLFPKLKINLTVSSVQIPDCSGHLPMVWWVDLGLPFVFCTPLYQIIVFQLFSHRLCIALIVQRHSIQSFDHLFPIFLASVHFYSCTVYSSWSLWLPIPFLAVLSVLTILYSSAFSCNWHHFIEFPLQELLWSSEHSLHWFWVWYLKIYSGFFLLISFWSRQSTQFAQEWVILPLLLVLPRYLLIFTHLTLTISLASGVSSDPYHISKVFACTHMLHWGQVPLTTISS